MPLGLFPCHSFTGDDTEIKINNLRPQLLAVDPGMQQVTWAVDTMQDSQVNSFIGLMY